MLARLLEKPKDGPEIEKFIPGPYYSGDPMNQPRRKAGPLARSHFSFEKRRKELEKQKKKEAKRLAKAERKAAIDAGEEIPEPIVKFDEFGNVVEIIQPVRPQADQDPETDSESAGEEKSSEKPDPA